jgi:hypothetical protein
MVIYILYKLLKTGREKKYISKLLSVLKFVNNRSVKQLALRLVLSFCRPDFKTLIHVRMTDNNLCW